MSAGVALYIEQRSPEWIKARCGCVTGSRVCDVMAKLKRKEGESAARYGYKMELAAETLTGRAMDHYCSPDMERGTELEPMARSEYEIQRGILCDQVGFVLHDGIDRFGSSPDGLIGDDGLIEIKAPRIMTHLEYIMQGVPPEEYLWQMMAAMSCTGRQWCDFVSYCPDLPEDLQLFVKRVPRDDKLISAMELEVVQFLKEVDELVSKIKSSNVRNS